MPIVENWMQKEERLIRAQDAYRIKRDFDNHRVPWGPYDNPKASSDDEEPDLERDRR